MIKWLSVNGLNTRVYEAGSGEEAVLFIHGGRYGELYSLDSWSRNFDVFGEQFRVVSFDKVGQGYTHFRGGPKEHTFDRVIEHCLGLFDDLLAAGTHIVAHSMGALLAAQVAILRPANVVSLTLVDSNSIAPDDERYPRGKFYRDLERRRPVGSPTRTSVRIEPDEQSYCNGHVTSDFVDQLLAIALQPEIRTTEAVMRGSGMGAWQASFDAARSRVRNVMVERGLPCPVLVVWGARDPSAPLPLGYRLFEEVFTRTRCAELLVLADAGHYCFREQPEVFDDSVISFCRRSGAGGRSS